MARMQSRVIPHGKKEIPLRKEDLKVLWHNDGTPYIDGRQSRHWSPLQRLQGLELLRRMVYGYDPETARIDRSVIEIVKTDFPK